MGIFLRNKSVCELFIACSLGNQWIQDEVIKLLFK